ncbi:MAG: acetyl-coenzyme A synthetase N-terminal domain-containing protein, partial [Chloroflexota bacterium]|nr:acetyl-coenzyme A synthetase N-terminal domain-containing protein [Chloroflexota bacterium]
MVQQGQIDHLLQETSEIQPPSHVYQQATLKDYDEVYQRSITDPETFWAEIASELDWFKPWDKIF